MKSANKKLPVAILGATGMVGQKFVELLMMHPWFKIVSLVASERAVGQKYATAARWMMSRPLVHSIADMTLSPCLPNLPCSIVFSALDASVAGEIERDFAESGYIVISNASNHRMDLDVPLLIPEVNSEHLDLVKFQSFSKGGMIVTNPNCSVIALSLALKPLIDIWGVELAHIVTLQAVSGAGYPGVPSMDIIDNVIPFISGEEAKLEQEPLKILGTLTQKGVENSKIALSAHCNRVAVMDGHMACVSIKLHNQAVEKEMIQAWNCFTSIAQAEQLPTAPKQPIIYHHEDLFPQPKLHRHLENGMAISIGGLRRCPLFDWKFSLLSHNTIRGAAGCAILNAELMLRKKYF